MKNQEQMKTIVTALGREKAVDVVMHAYNTELITSWLAHLEAAKTGKLGGPARRDHLQDALARVVEVCRLSAGE